MLQISLQNSQFLVYSRETDKAEIYLQWVKYSLFLKNILWLISGT